MIKKVYRYFFGFIKAQEKWLNKMAADGYRLVRTSIMSYEFEPCLKGEYEYCIEFVADKSYKKAKEYREFLEEMEYRTFTKNINIRYCIGKIKLRLWAKGTGKIATAPGSINKELLIIEKKRDGKPFELHTDLQDLIDYNRSIRNSYLYVSLLTAFILLCSFIKIIDLSAAGKFILGIIGALFVIPTIFYSKIIYDYKENQKTQE